MLRIYGIGQPRMLNPLACSRVCTFAFGIRNSFGFAFDPQTGNLWQTENGPECNDELNRIVKGGNHAWGPSATCSGTPPQNTNQDGPLPRLLVSPTIRSSPRLERPSAKGAGWERRWKDVVFGDWNRGEIHAATLTADRLEVASQRVILDRASGILAVERGTSGARSGQPEPGFLRERGRVELQSEWRLHAQRR